MTSNSHISSGGQSLDGHNSHHFRCHLFGSNRYIRKNESQYSMLLLGYLMKVIQRRAALTHAPTILVDLCLFRGIFGP